MLSYFDWFLRNKDFDSLEMGVYTNLKQTVGCFKTEHFKSTVSRVLNHSGMVKDMTLKISNTNKILIFDTSKV